ncbi:MAG TPA: SDR family oxidoreductase [Acidimicrobiales bacterium]|jgi:NAD(P)-dependent dehydrogenase (short-subunit alcohol dehydrogenase family)
MTLLDDKVCIVSGVGPGMGQAVARAMARDGGRVVLVARDHERLSQVADRMIAAGGVALPVPTDITDGEACAALVERTLEEFGRIDVLVNSAFRPDPSVSFLDADLDVWKKVHLVNVWGTFGLTQVVARQMVEQGDGGSIVNVSSMVVRKAMELQGAYGTSKGAVHVFTRILARELARHDIRVNSVVPGWMWGPSVQIYVDWLMQSDGLSLEEAKAKIAVDIPQGEIPSQEDCAEAIVFLASDRARVITGQALDVNGGEVFH